MAEPVPLVMWPANPGGGYFVRSQCMICLQATPAVSAARNIHVRALLLCSCIKMLGSGGEPVPDARKAYAKSCRACRYWLELGTKKMEALTRQAGVNVQDLLAAQNRFWSGRPEIEFAPPILGIYTPDDIRPRALRKHLIDFVKKNVTAEMILRFQQELLELAPAPPLDNSNSDEELEENKTNASSNFFNI